jgi:hypothetical protein
MPSRSSQVQAFPRRAACREVLTPRPHQGTHRCPGDRVAASRELAARRRSPLRGSAGLSNACSTPPVTTLPPWSRSPARAPATFMLVCLYCNSSPLWPRRSPRSALPPATPTLSPVSRRRARPQPSSSAGARTGKTRNPTCYPPSILPRGYRPTSICHSRMRRSTAKTDPQPCRRSLRHLPPPQRIQHVLILRHARRPMP